MYSMKECVVELCERSEIKEFVEANHYSKSINGLMCDYSFKLIDPSGKLIGAMIYGRFAMASVWKKYANSPEKVIELRRLCCIDETPKNAESYFIGATLRWLKKNTVIETVISYADPEYGHAGVIYHASNFKLIGKTAKGRVIWHGDKKYHDKAIRTKHKGELKPFAKRLVLALEQGEAHYAITQGKNVYEYVLVTAKQAAHLEEKRIKSINCEKVT